MLATWLGIYVSILFPVPVVSKTHRPSIKKLDGAPAPARLVAGDAAER